MLLAYPSSHDDDRWHAGRRFSLFASKVQPILQGFLFLLPPYTPVFINPSPLVR